MPRGRAACRRRGASCPTLSELAAYSRVAVTSSVPRGTPSRCWSNVVRVVPAALAALEADRPALRSAMAARAGRAARQRHYTQYARGPNLNRVLHALIAQSPLNHVARRFPRQSWRPISSRGMRRRESPVLVPSFLLFGITGTQSASFSITSWRRGRVALESTVQFIGRGSAPETRLDDRPCCLCISVSRAARRLGERGCTLNAGAAQT